MSVWPEEEAYVYPTLIYRLHASRVNISSSQGAQSVIVVARGLLGDRALAGVLGAAGIFGTAFSTPETRVVHAAASSTFIFAATRQLVIGHYAGNRDYVALLGRDDAFRDDRR